MKPANYMLAFCGSLLLILPVLLQAQSPDTSHRHGAALRASFQYNPVMVPDNEKERISNVIGSSFSLGVDFFRLALNHRWDTELGLTYEHRQYRLYTFPVFFFDRMDTPFDSALVSSTDMIRLHMIEVPLSLRHYWFTTNPYRLFAQGTLLFSGILGKQASHRFSTKDFSQKNSYQPKVEKNPVSGKAGIGLEYINAAQQRLFVLAALGYQPSHLYFYGRGYPAFLVAEVEFGLRF